MYLSLIFSPFLISLSLLSFGRFIGRNGAAILSLTGMFLNLIIVFFIIKEVILAACPCVIILPYYWFDTNVLVVEWNFLFDPLSVTMLGVVYFISTLVHLYSLGYMSDDPHLIRFMSYLSLFTFFMTILLTSGNFIQMFLGWEGVGLASYLLINFWFTRFQANKSALKAMVINRIGDLGLAIGIFLIFYFFRTVDFCTVFALTTFLNYTINIFDQTNTLLDFIAFFLFFGVVGKSAQFGLHAWLPDAMEGPTPVSALIHAATMVTAGVFLIIRCSYIFELATFTIFLVGFLGSLTAFFGSTVACFQTDLKKIIAYSTCSQLGYMILACGFSLYSSSLFHFFNHAFFKALLFLSAGAVIHALSGEQDIFNMGGLDIYLPFTTQMFVIGSIALASLPFFSGFYSKDWILEVTDVLFFADNLIFLYLETFAAVFTILYSNNLLSVVFSEEENFYFSSIWNIEESGFFISSALAVLALPSMFFGFLFKDLFLGYGTSVWLASIFFVPENFYHYEAEYLPMILKLSPILFSSTLTLIIFVGFDITLTYINRATLLLFISINRILSFVSDFFFFNWFYDSYSNYMIVEYFLPFCREIIFKLIDKGLLEFIGPYGLSNFFFFYRNSVSKMNTGYLFHYAFFLIFGVFYILFLNFFIFEMLSVDLLVMQFFFFIIIVLNFEKIYFFDWKN